MTKVEKLEDEIQKLNPEEFSALRDWFAQLDADQWDKQIEHDIQNGKLDSLAQPSLDAHNQGQSKTL